MQLMPDLEFDIADLYTELNIEKQQNKSLKIEKASSSEEYVTLFEAQEKGKGFESTPPGWFGLRIHSALFKISILGFLSFPIGRCLTVDFYLLLWALILQTELDSDTKI